MTPAEIAAANNWPFHEPERRAWRWVMIAYGGQLHRVAKRHADQQSHHVIGEVVTACGVTRNAYAPGSIHRPHRPRCKQCCETAGVPYGTGAPWDEGIDG